MNLRDKEDKLVEKLKNPKENHSSEIAKLIDETIRKKHKVYLMTDWHLWLRNEKNKPECHKHTNFDQIVNNIKNIEPDDLLIYLGDLVDGEFNDNDSLKNVLLPMNFKKVLVIGNNDLFSTAFYKSCGFDYVVRSFVWHNILFSHMPTKHDNDYNIHGHIHGYKTYWVPYNKHIDVGALNGRIKPVEINDVLKSYSRYSKSIKECPEHFNEGYIGSPTNIFMSEMFVSRVYDPYID